jgi:hypothetical protein
MRVNLHRDLLQLEAQGFCDKCWALRLGIQDQRCGRSPRATRRATGVASSHGRHTYLRSSQ